MIDRSLKQLILSEQTDTARIHMVIRPNGVFSFLREGDRPLVQRSLRLPVDTAEAVIAWCEALQDTHGAWQAMFIYRDGKVIEKCLPDLPEELYAFLSAEGIGL